MTQGSDKRVSPDISMLLRILVKHEVAFVVAGSVAVEAWGVDIGVPGDLDIVPSPDRENLRRLAGVLREVGGRSWPVTGRWETDQHGETRWMEFDAEDSRRGKRLPPPNPDDISTFDSLFSTKHGELDIVPRISGTYNDLIGRAASLTIHGVESVLTTSIEDLLAYLTVPRRTKDHVRVAVLRARQLDQAAPRRG